MEKLNIVEVLRDCPKGMELDCAMYENVEFDYIDHNPESTYPIHCLMKTNDGYNVIVFTNNGCNDTHPNAKCVIFPKGKTTWEGFQRPFKDGDVVATHRGAHIFIFKENVVNEGGRFSGVCYFGYDIQEKRLFKEMVCRFSRHATEEEKQKLFNAIKAKGYKWNAETKTLEKLIEPKFKVGDKIRHKTYIRQGNAVTEIKDTHYILDDELALPFTSQDEYELAPNKFDITTLKPFDKVLVRDGNKDKWNIDFFAYYRDSDDYQCMTFTKNQCIPYEGNEHLLGTTNDCYENYKTWE